MNIIQIQESLKDFSEPQLIREMQMPSGNVPQFLVLSELNRRKRVKSGYEMQKAANQPTVAQEVVAAAGMPQQASTDMARALAPKTSTTDNTGIGSLMPKQPTQAMKSGGVVKMQGGGRTIVMGGRSYNVDDIGNVTDSIGNQVRNPATLDAVMQAAGHPIGVNPSYTENSADTFINAITPELHMPQPMHTVGDPVSELPMPKPTPALDSPAPRSGSSPARAENPLSAFGFGPVGETPVNVAQPSGDTEPSWLESLKGSKLGQIGIPMPGSTTMVESRQEAQQAETGKDLAALQQLQEQQAGALARGDMNLARALQPKIDLLQTKLSANRLGAELGAGAVNAIDSGVDALRGAGAWVDENVAAPVASLFDPRIAANIYGSADETRAELARNAEARSKDAPTVTRAKAAETAGWAGMDMKDIAADDKAMAQSLTPTMLTQEQINAALADELGAGTPAAKAAQEDAAAKVIPPPKPRPDATQPTGGTGGGTGGGLGTLGSAGGLEGQLADMLKGMEKSREQDKWMALAQVGLQLMASKQPTLGGAIGEAGQAGLKAMQASKADYNKDKMTILALQQRIDAAKLAAAARGGVGGVKPMTSNQRLQRIKDAISMATEQLNMTTSKGDILRLQNEIDGLTAQYYAILTGAGTTPTSSTAGDFDVTK